MPHTTHSQYSYNHAGPSSAPPQLSYSQGTADVKPYFPPAPPLKPGLARSENVPVTNPIYFPEGYVQQRYGIFNLSEN